MKRGMIFILFLFFFFSLFAQTPKSWTSADIYLGLKKLNVLGSVLYVAAHPDDENTRLITYFSKEKLYRTGYLSLTRGDGGQNLIGNEQGIELGLIRTQELLAARRIDGGEQFFTRAFDFGFSKNPGETFTKWDREKILSDVVWVIRKFQPDVIITRFPVTGEGGHGHHTASAILANEAFTAAADPNRFPEQFQYGVKPWQAKRILWNTFNFGSTNTTGDDQFKFDVGGYNPLLGKSYGEIAAESRSQHKSQGFGVPASRGVALEYFKTTGGDAPVNDLMDGVDISWKKIKGGEAVSKAIDGLIASFDLLHPESSLKGLVQLYNSISALQDGYWKTQKLKEVQQLIEQSSGLFLDATTSAAYAVQTDSVRINLSLNNRLGSNTVIKKIDLNGFDSVLSQPLDKNKNINFSKTFFVPGTKEITQPYWLENKMEQGYYNVASQEKIGQPDVDPAYVINVTLNIEGRDFNFSKPVKYKFTDPVRGEIYQPLTVLPAVTFGDISPFYLKNNPNGILDASVIAHCNTATSSNEIGDINKLSKDTLSLVFTYHLKKDNTIHQPYAIANLENKTYRLRPVDDPKTGKILKSIHYDHIPAINYFKDAITTVKQLDLKTYGKKIGYIVGAGDKIPEALEQMGYEVTILGDKELSKNNIAQFDAIIAGVRAYNTDEWLNNHYDALMKYVNDGGNLIVQYNTSTQIGPIRAKIGPYNFDITRTRVTDENAIVKFLKPDHAVLNFPNKITSDDFTGWVQERSIYHAANWDKNFETIFSMNDPGENPDEGSLIIAKYGKGYFTYTGLVFYRELPAGVAGAYRLMANLIALNKKKAF
ncbi:MAG: PIG-L family deacetylase [Bacteroidetes bacterium]|nr:PIG-L family deacetylase [Bacteroidota bacterium]